MSIFSPITSLASNVGGALFGSGQTAGYLGTGQERFTPYNIDPNAAVTGNGANLTMAANNQYNQDQNRAAPTMQAAQLAPTATSQGAIINPTYANAASLGPATNMSAARISTGNDNQDRSQQNALNSQLALQASGQGPSVAGLQLQQATDQNNKQAMGMAASMQGQGNSSLAARNAMLAASSNDQNAAMQSAQTKIQEQQSAQQQLAGNLSNMRSADQGIATNQANLTQQANSTNAGTANQFALTNNANQQQINLANQAAANTAATNNASNTIANNQFNANALNSTNLAQGQLTQGANSSNLQSQLGTNQENDATSEYYYNQLQGMDQANRAAAMQMQGMQAQNQLGVDSQQAGAYNSAATRNGNFAGGLLSGGSSVLGLLSDENQKTNMTNLSDSDLDEIYGAGSGPGQSKPSSPFDQMKGMKTGGGGSASSALAAPVGGLASTAGNFGSMFKNSALGNVLFPQGGMNPAGGPQANPGGDYQMTSSGALNVQGTGQAINQSTILNPMSHPGAQPMGSSGFSLGPLKLSDKEQKTAMSKLTDHDLGSLPAYEYEYKDPSMPGAAPGKQYGPTAQGLEKTTIFAPSVSRDARGNKVVDTGRVSLALLAAVSDQQRRIMKLEARKG